MMIKVIKMMMNYFSEIAAMDGVNPLSANPTK